MSETHDRGYVLARHERGESDLFLELLLEDGRVRRAIARNAVRSIRRFSGGLSPFTRYRFLFGRAGASVSIRLEEAVVELAMPAILLDLRRTAAAGAASTLTRDLAGDAIDDPALYHRYDALLEVLNRADPATAGGALFRFALEGFAEAGHPIVLTECVRCEKSVPANALVQIRPESGGVVCGACGGGPFTLRAVERRAMLAVLGGDDSPFAASLLRWASRFLEPHAPRGAQAVRNAAAHWAPPKRVGSVAG